MIYTHKIEKAIRKASFLHRGQLRKGDGSVPFITHPFAMALILMEFTSTPKCRRPELEVKKMSQPPDGHRETSDTFDVGFTQDEDIIVGGILHDTIEETNYSYEELEKDFGKNIRNIVESLTECKKNEDPGKVWQERKDIYLKLMKDMSQKALMISAADKIHNLLSMIYDYETIGEEMWNKFNVPADKRLWFYGECLKILQKRLKDPIVEEYKKVLKKAHKIFHVK